MNDPIVESLRRLVAQHGGAVAVADKIGVNDQTIYQILKGIKLPSGRPKGVGPALRAKLDEHYPGWLDTAITGTSHVTLGAIQQVAEGSVHYAVSPSLAQALPVVLDAIAALTPTGWSMVRGGLDGLPGHPEMRDDVLGPLLAALEAEPMRRKQGNGR